MNTVGLRALLANSSARPWHMDIKDRMSSAVAVIWTPVEGAGGITIMCSQPARYRKHGDHDLIVAAVNALPVLLDVVEAAQEYTTCWEHAENGCFEWCQGCKDGHVAAERMAKALANVGEVTP